MQDGGAGENTDTTHGGQIGAVRCGAMRCGAFRAELSVPTLCCRGDCCKWLQIGVACVRDRSPSTRKHVTWSRIGYGPDQIIVVSINQSISNDQFSVFIISSSPTNRQKLTPWFFHDAHARAYIHTHTHTHLHRGGSGRAGTDANPSLAAAAVAALNGGNE